MFRRNRWTRIETCFGETQRDLATNLIPLPSSQEDFSNRQADADAISSRHIERTREALHRAVAVAESEQSGSGRRENFHSVAAQSLRRLDVIDRLVAISLFGMHLRHQGVNRGV